MDINPINPGSTEGNTPEPEAPVQNTNEQVAPSTDRAQVVPRPMNPDVAPPATPSLSPDEPVTAPAPQVFTPSGATPPEPAVPTPPVAETPTPPVPPAPTPDASPAQPVAGEVSGKPAPAAPEHVVGGVDGVVTAGGKRNLKKLLVPVVAAVVVLGASIGVYAGYYLPNKPENMWHSALVNSGKGYDKLTQYATTNKKAKGWSETGNFKFTGPFVADGTMSGKSDGKTGDFSGTLSATGLKLGLDVRSFASTGDTPDIYFKLDGLQGLGSLIGGFGADPSVSNALNGLNGQWYVVDHTFFEQYMGGSSGSMQVTSADVSSILNAVGKASKQYVFTADDKKAVVVVKQQVGKEKFGNRSTYHYKVGVNKQNLKAYIDALCNDLQASKLSSLLPSGENVQDALNCADIRTSADNLKETATADAWVDTRTKLIRDIRFYDETDKNNYFDIGQDYQGGNSFPFLLSAHSKDGDATSDVGAKLTLDTKTNSFTFEGQYKSSGPDSENGTITFVVTPNNTAVKVDKPANAKTIIELANDLGLGSLLSGGFDTGGAATNANDAKRQSDIQSLQTQVEAYWADNTGSYPTLAQLTSATWRKAKMPELDAAALKDPEGTSSQLAAAPAAHVYAYVPGGCTAKGCTSYSLIATLSDGSKYTKTNLD